MKHLSHFLSMLQNVSVEMPELTRELNNAVKIAKQKCRTIHVSWSGDFDLIVYPSGNFQIVPLASFKLYKISDESDVHCEEVVL